MTRSALRRCRQRWDGLSALKGTATIPTLAFDRDSETNEDGIDQDCDGMDACVTGMDGDDDGVVDEKITVRTTRTNCKAMVMAMALAVVTTAECRKSGQLDHDEDGAGDAFDGDIDQTMASAKPLATVSPICDVYPGAEA